MDPPYGVRAFRVRPRHASLPCPKFKAFRGRRPAAGKRDRAEPVARADHRRRPAQELRTSRGASRSQLLRRSIVAPGDHRAVRLREIDAPALPERSRAVRLRPRAHRRRHAGAAQRHRAARSQAPPAPPARGGRDGVPELQPVPAHDRPGKRREGAVGREGAGPEGGRGERAVASGEGRPERPPRLLPVAALGGPAAARRHRPGADDGAEGDAVRRADVLARPHAGPRGAADHAAAPRRGDDAGGRDPRNALRAGRRRQNPVPAPGAARRVGAARGDLRRGPRPAHARVPEELRVSAADALLRMLSRARRGGPAAFIVLAAALYGGTVFAAEPLRWGADSEGGAPYVFPDPKDPRTIIGFEQDLAEALGRELGRPSLFVQNQWDGLIPGLLRGNYDLAMNGLEITPDREQVIRFSLPYYATSEQLSVRKEESSIDSLDDLKGRTVGTLKASLAQRILERVGGIEVRSYEGQINAYEDL